MNKETTDYESHTEDIKSKPREFWLDLEGAIEFDDDLILKGKPRQKYIEIYTHVIEYSAYEKLQSRIKQLENEKKLLIDGLEFYKKDELEFAKLGDEISESLIRSLYFYGETARRTLKKIEPIIKGVWE